MRKYNAKQLGLIAASIVAAVIVNWLAWLLVMGRPTNIDAMYHILTVVCLAAAFVLIGDRFAKTEIFK